MNIFKPKHVIEEPAEFPFEMKFLDATIKNSGNSDGFVPVIYDFDGPLGYQHLGNYSTLKSAMKGTFLHFLINRPGKFSSMIFRRMIGNKTYHEWFTFKKVCEEEGVEIPKWIYISEDMNCTVMTDFENELSPTLPDDKELASHLFTICDRVHASCDDDCPVYRANGSQVPDTANDFDKNRGCDCFKDGKAMLKFLYDKKVEGVLADIEGAN